MMNRSFLNFLSVQFSTDLSVLFVVKAAESRLHCIGQHSHSTLKSANALPIFQDKQAYKMR